MSSFIPGSNYNDSLEGGVDGDTFYGSLGNDTLDGYGGIDTVNYRTLQNASAQGYTLVSGVQANLAIGRVQKFFISYSAYSYFPQFFTFTDVLRNIENLVGTALADTLTGNAGNNMLDGDEGDDTLRGDAGDDQLYGRAGNDALYGQADNDRLYGGAGNDLLDGGAGGIDTADYSLSGMAGGVKANLVTGKVEKFLTAGLTTPSYIDTLVEIEDVVGTAAADILLGNERPNGLFGGGGNDTLKGGAGNDL
ncbi:calcium-binding protein, partial [Polaromonas sp. YR568]|uniref:calcium-binding protein n=1 Tax=Polaromonas sp. YR568 TaxID=1855301 RepID=UPI00398BC89D